MFTKILFAVGFAKTTHSPNAQGKKSLQTREIYNNNIMNKLLILTIILMLLGTSGICQSFGGKEKILTYKYFVTDYENKRPYTRYGYRVLVYYDYFPSQFRYKGKDEKKMSNSERDKFIFPLSLMESDDINIDSTGLFVTRHLSNKYIMKMDTSKFVPDESSWICSYDTVQFIGSANYIYKGKITPYLACKFEYKFGWRHHFVEICPQLGIVNVTYYDKNKNVIRSEELVEINKEPVDKWISNNWTVPCFKPLFIRAKRFTHK